jgi:membrane-associated protein
MNMDIVLYLMDFFLHLDKHLNEIVQSFGIWAYLILFLIIFCETGLVVTPFLPGDSLIFAAGTLSATGAFNLPALYFTLLAAAILGNLANYTIGHFIGPKVFHFQNSFFFKKEYLERAHKFYDKYGGLTVIITRFMPILRTFSPFVAGVGYMNYPRFIIYNFIGGTAWVSLFIFLGFFFGNIPVIKNNFLIVVIAIIIISVMPIVVEIIRNKFFKKKEDPVT